MLLMTCPCPPHWLHVLAVVPGFVPLPSHVPQFCRLSTCTGQGFSQAMALELRARAASHVIDGCRLPIGKRHPTQHCSLLNYLVQQGSHHRP